MWETLITMYKTEGGFFALYRGIVPTVAGVAPYVSAFYSFWDYSFADFGKGRSKFHDLRISEEMAYARGRQESDERTQIKCWCHIRCCSPDLHLSFVRTT